MQRFTRTVARNSAFGMGAQMAIKVISFIFQIVIARRLGPEEYGQYAAVLAFGAMFVFIADLGLATYMVREIARWRDQPDGMQKANALFGNVLLLRFLLALLAATLLITTAWLTGRPIEMIIAIALGTLGLIMYSAQGASEAVLAGFERLDVSSSAKVLQQVVFLAVGLIALIPVIGYYGLIFANLCGVTILTIACWRGARRMGIQPMRAAARTWPALLRASIPFGIIGFTLGLSYKFDSVLLNIYHGDRETGYYNAAYNLVFSAVILSNVLNTSLYPSLTRQAASTPDTMGRIYGRALRYLLMIALPIAIGGWSLADQIVPFLFDDQYQRSIQVLQIVIWVVPLMYASEFLGYIVLIQGNERKAARAVIVSTSVNVIMNLIIVPRYGLLGAAILTVVTEAVLVGQYVWLLRAQLRQLPLGQVLLRPLLAALLMGGVVLSVNPYVPELFPHLRLLVSIAAGVATYAGLLILLGVIGKDEWRFAQSLRQRADTSESSA